MIPDSDGKISDADLVAEFRLAVTELDTATDSLDRYTLTEWIELFSDDAFAAALRELDRLTAEVERLRAACEDAAGAVEYRAESDKLRAALESEADHD